MFFSVVDSRGHTEAGETVAITGSVSGEYQEGDEVTLVINGESYTDTVDKDGKFSIDVKGSDLAADSDKTIDGSVVATDEAGNTGTIKATKAYGVDTDGPSGSGDTPTTLVIDDVTEDNIINATEAGETVAITGSVSGEYQEGDEVTLVINGESYTDTVDKDGKFSIDVKGSDLAADSDKTIEGSVVATDEAGNTGTIKATKAYGVDTIAPDVTLNTVIVADSTDVFGKEVEGGDGFISKKELDNLTDRTTDVTVKLEGDVKEGDIITLTSSTGQKIDSITITGSIVTSREVTFTGIELPADGDTLEVTATIKDIAGNVGDSATDSAIINPVSAPETKNLDIKLQEDGNINQGNLNRPEIKIKAAQLDGKSPEEIELRINGNRVDFFYRINDDRSVTFFPQEALDNGKYILALVGGTEAVTSDVTVNAGHTFSVADFVYGDINGEEMTGIEITSLPVNGTLYYDGARVEGPLTVDNPLTIAIGDIDKLVYVPAKDKSDNDVTGSFAEIGFKVFNNASEKPESAEKTITIKVEPVSDGTFTTVVDTALTDELIISSLDGKGGEGFYREYQSSDLKFDISSQNGIRYIDGFNKPKNIDFIKGAIETTLLPTVETVNIKNLLPGFNTTGDVTTTQLLGSNKNGSYGGTTGADNSVSLIVKFEGLIYLEAGEKYNFGSNGTDDSVVINLGGATVFEQNAKTGSAGIAKELINCYKAKENKRTKYRYTADASLYVYA